MCGIAAIVTPRGVDVGDLRAMSAAVAHRGPDGFGYLLCGPGGERKVWHNTEPCKDGGGGAIVGLAHRRLSIIDLSDASLQPMADGSGSLSVVYNGEIYNYIELREELSALGHAFRTTGDTEVLLEAYRAWGPACVRHFVGMWAFALLDVPNRRLFLSRDRFGVKPLYYALRGNALHIASEIKGILAASGMPKAPDESTVAEYLALGAVDRSDRTFFEGIFSLPPAHNAMVSLDALYPEVRPEPYWNISADSFHGSAVDASACFRTLFLDAVRLHGRSDMPVGTCLSGGVDSSSIVCVSDQLRREGHIPSYGHHAFGYIPADDRLSEESFMRIAAVRGGARLHRVDVGVEEFETILPEILRAQDEPFASASVAAQWFVFRRARREGITVMLDGQGADETLGGYHYYFAPLAALRLSRLDLAGYRKMRATFGRDIGPFPATLRELLAMIVPPSLKRIARPFLRGGGNGLLLSPRLARMRAADPDEHRALPSSLAELLGQEVRATSLPALLRYEDRNSMSHAIEARVPFLDHRLVEFAFSLPDDLKIRGAETKYVLREAMRGVVPDAILDRKEKLGFRADPRLTAGLVRRMGKELVPDSTEWERRWIAPGAAERALSGATDDATSEFSAWRVINLKLWTRQYWG